MKQDRLNNYLLVYCHKSITDTLDTVKIARANEQRKWHFEKFEEGCAYVWVEDEPLPPPNPPPNPPPPNPWRKGFMGFAKIVKTYFSFVNNLSGRYMVS